MDLKKIIGVLGFLIVGFMPKANATIYVPTILIIEKDTFEMSLTFMSSRNKITSNYNKMGSSYGFFRLHVIPTWEIENDSLFLKQLQIRCLSGKDSFADLANDYKKNYINGRVFAKEISYQIFASRGNLFKTDYSTDTRYYCDNLCFISIKHGKIISLIEFTGITHQEVSTLFTAIPNELQSTNWFIQPEVPLNGGTKVTTKIVVDDKGKVTKTEFTEGGDKRWNKTIVKFIKLLSGSFFGQISYIDYEPNYVRRKKEKVIFIVKKPRN